MRIARIYMNGTEHLGIWSDGKILVLQDTWARAHQLPLTMEELITEGSGALDRMESLKAELLRANTEAGVWLEDSAAQYYPVVPHGRKIVCVGLNYLKHVNESRLDLPKSPLLFSKFDNALAAHRDTVPIPAGSTKLDYEAEIAVVMGRKARNVPESEALDYVLGYTLANDLSARDLQFATSQWLLGKSCDGFCPVGPTLVTKDEVPDINQVGLRCFVNGELRQDGNTEQMIFSFTTLISYISHHFTLEPGDVILSGTPDGVVMGMPDNQQQWLQPGDEVRVEADFLGTLVTVIGSPSNG